MAKKPTLSDVVKGTSAGQKAVDKAVRTSIKDQAKTTAEAKKKRTGGQKNTDWYSARNDYLTDNTITYRDIAKKYGTSTRAVEYRAKQEKWVELRRDFGEKAFEEFKIKLIDQKSRAASEHLLSYQNVRSLVNRAAIEMSERNYERDSKGHLVLDSKKQPVPSPLSAFELEKLAKALHQAIVGERIVLGMPSSVSAITDGKGDDIFKGLSDLFAKAKEPDGRDTTAAS